MMLAAALINPAFSHGGVTVLCYLPSGNPLTLESILYGFAAAAMLAAILLWFRCYTTVMTSDKFAYLFGRIIPALSLVLSMALRFVPRFKAQLDIVREAQSSIGRDVTNGTLFRRTKIFHATGTADLSKLLSFGGMTLHREKQIKLYAVLIVSLFVCALATWRKSELSDSVQTPKEKRKLNKRTAVASVLVLLLVPLTLFFGVFYLGRSQYYITALVVLIECMIPFFLIFEGRKPQARELVVIAVLCAIGIAGRAVFFMLPQFKPAAALTVIAGIAFGGETGFLVGAITMLASNMLFSQGPWTPFQMFAMGLIGFLAGIFFKKRFYTPHEDFHICFRSACSSCNFQRNYESVFRPHLEQENA